MGNVLYNGLFGRHEGQSSDFLKLFDGKVVSHDAFIKMAAGFANTLVQMGLEPGERVAVQVKKSPESLAVYAACIQAGLVFLPLNYDYTGNEVLYFIEDSGAALLICDGTRMGDLKALIDKSTQIKSLNGDGSGTFADLANIQDINFETVDRHGNDLAALLYTSGTTGRSKGAMLTHDNLLSNAQTLADVWQFSAKDVLLHALPIFHTHGLFVATNITLIAGGSMIFLPKFNLDMMISSMKDASVMMGVPTFYTRLLSDPRFNRELTAHMRLFISGSAPLLAETHEKFEQKTGHKILERYGMTETNMNTSNPYEGERRAGTVGFALPGVEIKITDPATGTTLRNGEIGEIEVRGPNVFKGYWQMPEKTALELRQNGFFITGDLGVIDEEGYVKIVGRNKDVIISGGYNIYPKEIETLLDKLPDIVESAVIGAPHPDFGETVIGVVVAQNGANPDLEMVNSRIAKSLARFKLPRKLVVVSELPRNAMGKVQKNILREKFSREFS